MSALQEAIIAAHDAGKHPDPRAHTMFTLCWKCGEALRTEGVSARMES